MPALAVFLLMLTVTIVELSKGERGAAIGFIVAIGLALFTAAAGMLFGAALGLAFAPTSFLTGPIGSRWTRVIGTKSPAACRIVCVVVVVAFIAPVVLLTIYILDRMHLI